jgi:hypothetical protein
MVLGKGIFTGIARFTRKTFFTEKANFLQE